MSEQEIAEKWIDEMATEIDRPDLMHPHQYMPVAKQCALIREKGMVEYRVPPLEYWQGVVSAIENTK